MNSPIERYLAKQADLTKRPLVADSLDGIRAVVVIPALAEHDAISDTLATLANNKPDHLSKALVIVVVNSRTIDHTPADAIDDNLRTLTLLESIVSGHTASPFGQLRIAYIDAASAGHELGPKQGVGHARKIGLDWGLKVLHDTSSGEGLLINLDADTHVEPNYLEAIHAYFAHTADGAGVVEFSHRLEGTDEQQTAIIAYELFLRYHVLGLKYASSPYAFHSIGSTIACTSKAYAAAGGMKRRQAGEDFYFLQDLAKTGRVGRITSTTVHPSPRPSWRVPFGTGKRVQRFIDQTHEEHLVYHPDTYHILRSWLRTIVQDPDRGPEKLMCAAKDIAPQLADFLSAQRFPDIWPDLRQHAPDPESLTRQFHRWFDAFKTLKLMHHLRDNRYPEQNTFEALSTLLNRLDSQIVIPPDIQSNLHQQSQLLFELADLERSHYLPTGTPRT